MKLPRWLMIVLWTSSVLAVLAAAGWWWLTWPERTAREFVEWVGKQADGSDERPRRTRSRVWFQDPVGFTPISSWGVPELAAKPRSLVDVLLGRQEFLIAAEHEWNEWDFAVERGKVIRPTPSAFYFADDLIVDFATESKNASFSTRKGPLKTIHLLLEAYEMEIDPELAPSRITEKCF